VDRLRLTTRLTAEYVHRHTGFHPHARRPPRTPNLKVGIHTRWVNELPRFGGSLRRGCRLLARPAIARNREYKSRSRFESSVAIASFACRERPRGDQIRPCSFMTTTSDRWVKGAVSLPGPLVVPRRYFWSESATTRLRLDTLSRESNTSRLTNKRYPVSLQTHPSSCDFNKALLEVEPLVLREFFSAVNYR